MVSPAFTRSPKSTVIDLRYPATLACSSTSRYGRNSAWILSSLYRSRRTTGATATVETDSATPAAAAAKEWRGSGTAATAAMAIATMIHPQARPLGTAVSVPRRPPVIAAFSEFGVEVSIRQGGCVVMGKREPDLEVAAAVHGTGDLHFATLRAAYRSHDGQAKAGSVGLPGARGIDAEEPVEHVGQGIGGNPDPGVGDFQDGAVSGGAHPQAHRPSLRRVLDCVVD